MGIYVFFCGHFVLNMVERCYKNCVQMFPSPASSLRKYKKIVPSVGLWRTSGTIFFVFPSGATR